MPPSWLLFACRIANVTTRNNVKEMTEARTNGFNEEGFHLRSDRESPLFLVSAFAVLSVDKKWDF